MQRFTDNYRFMNVKQPTMVLAHAVFFQMLCSWHEQNIQKLFASLCKTLQWPKLHNMETTYNIYKHTTDKGTTTNINVI